ncbi:MAG: hypothetical protein AAFX94_11835 [Myxococcota bacterium]
MTSTDATRWVTVITEEEFLAEDNGWIEWGFDAVEARYIRLTALETSTSRAVHYAVLADLRVHDAPATGGSVSLTWIAPGDDGVEGRATSYDIFVADTPQGIGAATPLVVAASSDAGALTRVTLKDLDGEQELAVAVRARDESNNTGPLSEVKTVTTNPVAPAAVADLTAVALGTDEVRVRWSASGDDGHSGQATRQELRYARWAITSRNFESATVVTTPLPGAPNSEQTVTVDGLQAGALYRFAVVTFDEAGHRSALSNISVVQTDPVPDVTAPAAVLDLVASTPTGGQSVAASQAVASTEELGFEAAGVVDGDPNTFWFTPPGAALEAAVLEVRFSGAPVLGAVTLGAAVGYESVFPVAYDVSVSADGLQFETVGESFPPQRVAAVRITVLERAALGSAFYAAIGSVVGVEPLAGSGAVVLDWSAVGDDVFDGRAAEYQLAASACPFDAAAATPLALDLPKQSGAPERAVVALTPGVETCFEMTVVDDAGNRSEATRVGPVVP